jgi:cell division protein FtsZ
LFEVNEAAEIIHDVAHAEANIIFGTVVDENLGEEIRVTVIAAGFDRFEDMGRDNGLEDILGVQEAPPEISKPARRTRRRVASESPAPPPPPPPPIEPEIEETIDLFDEPEDDLDDEFDVPSFLK